MNRTVKNSSVITKEQVGDPRIDSPQIKVVYPVEELPLKTEQEEQAPLQMQTKATQTENQPTEGSPQKDATEPHTCTLSFQDAIKAHQVAFILTGFGILLLGFIIGKNKI